MRWRAIVLGVAVSSLILRSELLPIRTYTIADGLAADSVYGIVADSRGFLWFSTSEGLSRFDGYRFVTYGVEEGLPHRLVTTLIETRSGDHWIGTPRGLSRISTVGGAARFTNYRLAPDAAANNIRALVELRSGAILAATPSGLFEWTDPSSFRRRELPGIDPLTISDMVEDQAGNLWIGTTTSGIYVYGVTPVNGSGILQSFNQKNGLPGNWVNMLLFDSKGRLWAAVRGGLAMLSQPLISQGSAGNWSVEQVYSKNSALVGTDVTSLHEGLDGSLWVGTALGISRLSWRTGGLPAIENLTRDQGLSDRVILSLGEDQAGNIWAGTEGAGVIRIDRVGFTTYREQDGLASDRVFSVFEDRAGELVTVTSGAGNKKAHSVDIFDGVRFHSVSPGRLAENPTWGWDRVLLQSRTGEWWGATNRGLCRYGPSKAAELNHRTPRTCYTSDVIFRIFEDSHGGIWASAQSRPGDRLMRWDPDTNQVFTFPSPPVSRGPGSDLVSAFAEDSKGNIWMGLYAGGLYRYDGHRFEYFQTSDGVPGGTVFALYPEGDALWVGSNGGLGRIENTRADKLRAEIYDTTRGMSSNSIVCITSDLEGRIYAGTSKGVDRLEPKTGHIRHFSSANGLAHGALKAAFRDRNGSLWFATTQGLSRLIPTGPIAAKPPITGQPVAGPRILITDLRIGGVAYPVSDVGEARVSGLELKPSQNQLQVDFVGIDYEPGDILRYTYKLESADSDWSPPRSQHAVNYAALSPGKYHFRVKAVTSDGVESAVPAQIDFIVLPPVWRRWWFESLALAIAIAGVFAAHRYRVAQAVRLERIRTTIATDLHDDIGASLSQIAILSEVARVNANGQGRANNQAQTNGQGQGAEPLERVATLARELVDSMSDIVWSIRSEAHGMDSLIRRMREFAIDLLSSQGIDFELRTPPLGKNVELSLQARRQVFLIFKECIHNAARHSRCSAVVAELKIADREAVLTIEDNGTGLRPEDKTADAKSELPGGTGIPNMRRRSQELGGRMELTSRPGEGCSVEIRFPMRRSVFS
jgi:ligand-binding sensor domain-containing protein/signal transduction histidine kinase